MKTLQLKTLNGSTVEFSVRPIKRKDRKKIREDYKIDILQEFFKLGNSKEVTIPGDIVDAILDVVYSDKDAEVENLGMMDQINLVSETISQTFGAEEEIKKN